MTRFRRSGIRSRYIGAQVAELVDALASGASDLYGRGGSSPLLGTTFPNLVGLTH